MHASDANAAERKLETAPGMTIGVTQLRPQSRGTIHIASPDPHMQPEIRPNVPATETDRATLVAGKKIARDLIAQAPMDRLRGEELSPGAQWRSDADWLAFAQDDGQTIDHVAGTCRMGADASAAPTMAPGDIQAAVFMIAEKASDLILSNQR